MKPWLSAIVTSLFFISCVVIALSVWSLSSYPLGKMLQDETSLGSSNSTLLDLSSSYASLKKRVDSSLDDADSDELINIILGPEPSADDAQPDDLINTI